MRVLIRRYKEERSAWCLCTILNRKASIGEAMKTEIRSAVRSAKLDVGNNINATHSVWGGEITYTDSKGVSRRTIITEMEYITDLGLCEECLNCPDHNNCTRTNIKKHDGKCWRDEQSTEVNHD